MLRRKPDLARLASEVEFRETLEDLIVEWRLKLPLPFLALALDEQAERLRYEYGGE